MGWTVSGWACRSKLDLKGFCTVGGGGVARCALLAPLAGLEDWKFQISGDAETTGTGAKRAAAKCISH